MSLELTSEAFCQRISDANEALVLETMVTLLDAISGAYPTTLENDEKRLASEDVSGATRACLRHIISQKIIVRSNMAFVKAVASSK